MEYGYTIFHYILPAQKDEEKGSLFKNEQKVKIPIWEVHFKEYLKISFVYAIFLSGSVDGRK